MREGVTSQPLTADCVENTHGACVRNVRELQLRADCTKAGVCGGQDVFKGGNNNANNYVDPTSVHD